MQIHRRFLLAWQVDNVFRCETRESGRDVVATASQVTEDKSSAATSDKSRELVKKVSIIADSTSAQNCAHVSVVGVYTLGTVRRIHAGTFNGAS